MRLSSFVNRYPPPVTMTMRRDPELFSPRLAETGLIVVSSLLIGMRHCLRFFATKYMVKYVCCHGFATPTSFYDKKAHGSW